MRGSNKKIKVCQVIYSGLGGHGAVSFAIAEESIAKNACLEFSFIFYGVEEINKDYIDRCLKLGLNYEYIKKKKGVDLISFISVCRGVNRLSPDVILLHSITSVFQFLFSKIFVPFKLISIEHNSNTIKTKFEWVCSWAVVQFSKYVVYLSDEYKRQIELKFGRLKKLKNCNVIPNGIKSIDISKTERNKKYITMAGRFNNLRDYNTLLLAFNELRKEENALELAIAGEGETLEKTKIFASNLECKNLVHFYGKIGEKEMNELYEKTFVYVQSSLAETLSTSVLQAMSYGIPIVGTDISGINNLIENGEDGLLFDLGDFTTLKYHLKTLYKDRVLYDKLSLNAKDKVSRKYSSAVMFDSYSKLILEE